MSENTTDYRDFDLSFVDYDKLYEKIPNKYKLTQTIIKLGHKIIESHAASQINIKTAIQMAVDEILKDNFEFIEGEIELKEDIIAEDNTSEFEIEATESDDANVDTIAEEEVAE